MRYWFFFAIYAVWLSNANAAKYGWIGFDNDNNFTANVIVSVDESCPVLHVDKVEIALERSHHNHLSNIEKCSAVFKRGAEVAEIEGHKVSLPGKSIRRIGLIGDTGCFSGSKQPCNIKSKWPFAQVAASLAKQDIDLVIHLGDLLYMEDSNALKRTAKSKKYGFNIGSWDNWEFEFFAPMEPLLWKVPLIVVKGNHESRGTLPCFGAGFFFGNIKNDQACQFPEPLQKIVFDNVAFFNLDSSSSSDFILNQKLAEEYRHQLSKQLSRHDGVLNIFVSHRPVWGKFSIFNADVYSNRTLRYTLGNIASYFDLAIAGHVHLVQLLSFADSGAAQLIVGNGGAKLLKLPAPPDGANASRAEVSFVGRKATLMRAVNKFGFGVLSLEGGMNFDAFDADGNKLFNCSKEEGFNWLCHI